MIMIMNNTKKYVYVFCITCRGVRIDTMMKVFSNKEKAIEHFKKIAEGEKRDLKEEGYTIYNDEIGDGSCIAWWSSEKDYNKHAHASEVFVMVEEIDKEN